MIGHERTRVLVTGGAGFVGSHLVDRLLDEGCSVDVVDTLDSGRAANLPARDGLNVIVGNAADTTVQGYDELYHLASAASRRDYEQRQRRTLIENARGTQRALEIALASHARFVLVSTSEIYGEPTVHPQHEEYWGAVDPTGPRSAYDEAKRFAEALVAAYVRETQVDACIVRLFNTYGPRMRVDDGRVPSAFIAAALQGHDLLVEGDGEQSRSFCYVADSVSGIVAALRRGRPGRVYNVGNPQEISVIDFAHVVRELACSSSQIVFVPARASDVAHRCPDITRARAELGWSPQTPLRDGLVRSLEWYRRLLY